MSNSGSVLIVDAERETGEAISSYLRKQGYDVLTVDHGRDALSLLKSTRISFVILDLQLPDMSGESLCVEIRKNSRVPIIILSARSREEDICNGLELGADDYITKPFSMKNLHARIRAVARRSSADLQPLSRCVSWNGGDLVIHYENREVLKNGKKIMLTPSEWKLLSVFSQYPSRVFSRDDLLEIGFDHAFDGYDRIIDTHVKNLRRKIEDDVRNPCYIQTVYGMGYRFGGETCP